MSIVFEERFSDSPYVEKIGRFRVEEDYSQTCAAGVLWNMLLVKLNGKTSLSVWGPETKSAIMSYPKGAEFMFIHFKFGTFMPYLPARNLVDTGIILPDAASKSFWLQGSAWQFPDYENVDTFINWLAHDGLIAYEPIVGAVMQKQPQTISARTVRHRFLRATGLTKSFVSQIERARRAAALLERGESILDTVDQAGYADQPHMTRSLKRFIGQTPAQFARLGKSL